MNRKTVIITTPYFPPQGGGLERYALQIARLLGRDYDWRVIMISSDKSKADSVENKDGITVYKLKCDYRISNTPVGLGWYRKIRDIIAKENPDLINIHTPVPGLGDIASFAGRNIPQVITYHTGSMKKGKPLVDLALGAYESTILKIMLGRAEKIICSSDSIRFGFLKKYAAKSATVTPGVDCGLFSPDPKKTAEKKTLLFVAKLENGQEYKGLRTLIDALQILQKNIPEIKLKVAGDGDMKEWYKNYAEKCGLGKNIDFLGNLEDRRLIELYQSGSMLVLPTAKDSYPLAVLESMSCGLPVISTTIGGIPEMVENGKEGFLIQPGKPLELAEKIREITTNPSLQKRFSEAARTKAVRFFGWDERIRRYEEILEASLRKKPAYENLWNSSAEESINKTKL